jgi:glycosyltransferase involved in cell wall biosynthesis
MKLSIIIPVYNEEGTIKEIISRVKKVKISKDITKEIIVIDDKSTDSSLKILKKIKDIKLLNHKKNQGKGATIRSGLKHSTGEVIIIQDADLEYNPEDYSRLISPIITNKADVVYGSRLKNYPIKIFGKKHTPFLTHYLGNKFLSFVTRLLYGSNITDMETCYKIFKKEVIKNIKLEFDRFEFEPEITAKILKAGYKIHEVSIKVTPRGYDEGKKITWKDGFMAIWTLVKYRFID